jgi:hypothetical protein
MPVALSVNNSSLSRCGVLARYEKIPLTQIVYDRVERGQLAVKQGKWTEENFIKPYQDILEQWAANYTVNSNAA